MNQILLAIASGMFYLLATLLLALQFKQNRPENQVTKSHLFSTAVALLLHALLLGSLLPVSQGINLSFFNSLTLFAWVIALVGLVVGLSNRLEFIGLIIFPICIVSMILALTFPGPVTRPVDFTLLLDIHVLLSIVAYGILSSAALLALVLALQDYQLHHHITGRLGNLLPPLLSVERLMFQLIMAGFGTLTLALITGFMFTTDWFNHKILFSCLAWLVFLVLLIGRYVAGWRGRKAIRWTLGGVLALMLAFFGTKLVMEFILSR
ncbi:MAG TPA: cytochrome c biogenesis protein CcsA [Gammaproteobacteria bacterium]